MNEYHTPSQLAHGSRKPTGFALAGSTEAVAEKPRSPLSPKGMGGSSAVAAMPTPKKKSLEVAKTTSKKDHAFSSLRSLVHFTTTDNNLPGSAWGANLKPRDELVMPLHYYCKILHIHAGRG